MLGELTKAIVKILDRDNRPSLSKLIYLSCGLLGVICLISMVSPFHFSWSLIDNVSGDANWADDNSVLNITFWMVIAHLFVFVLRKIAVRVFQNISNSELRIIYSTAYTIDDIVEFVAAVFSLVFMFSVFIQMYKTQMLFQSGKAYFIYIIIGIKCMDFIFNHFRARNLKVIDNVINKYPDLD